MKDFSVDLKQLVGDHFEDNFGVGSWRYFEEVLKGYWTLSEDIIGDHDALKPSWGNLGDLFLGIMKSSGDTFYETRLSLMIWDDD